jgi:ribosome-associated toxin RatA of RatAB toxin-antitoxin module
MTMLSGSSSAEAGATIERCWELVAAVQRWPDWQQGLARVDVVEHDEHGRAAVCDAVADARVVKVRCRVSIAYDAPHRLTFSRLASEDLDALEGAWTLEVAAADRTLVTYELALDPGPVPLLARPLVATLRPLVVGRRAQELATAVSRP